MRLLFNLLAISGAIFWFLVLFVLYVVLGMPLPERVETTMEPMIEQAQERTEAVQSAVEASTATDEQQSADTSVSPASPAQENALKALGIDPNSVSEVTPEQEECFVRTLGQTRVDEVKGGAVPTPSDLFKARECL